MPLSQLADAIYQHLRLRVPQAKLQTCKITYRDLVEGLPPLAQPFGNLHWQDPRLDQALGELVSECGAKDLPAISAIVVNGQTRQPGRRYYEVAHPAAAGPL